MTMSPRAPSPRRRVSRALPLAALTTLALLAARPAPAGPIEEPPPYPPSAHIADVTFDWDTYRRRARGSDNWPMTWAADGSQYTSFGDGGGLGGNDTRGRVSLGFARITGGPADFVGENVWGGVSPAAPATFNGKSYGVLAVDNTLYMWRCGAGSTTTAFDFQQLYRSDSKGRSWRPANWQFAEALRFYCPTFLQFGKGYEGAPDPSWVYMYAARRNNGEWDAHTPGEIVLMRAPTKALFDRSEYQFYAGRNGSGPIWSANVADLQPVFTDPRGARLASAAYNPGLGRYLLVTEHSPKATGRIGVFDAPTPWGPWTTAMYESDFGAPAIIPRAFFGAFAPAWWTDGGRGFTFVFTGGDTLDAWNSVSGAFRTAGAATTPRASSSGSSRTASTSRGSRRSYGAP